MGQFCRYLLSVSHVVQGVPPQFELKLFMNQLVVAVQLEANIIGQQLWIGSFFARPCCKRGLVCEARTFCHSSPNVSMGISCRLSLLHTEIEKKMCNADGNYFLSNRQKILE